MLLKRVGTNLKDEYHEDKSDDNLKKIDDQRNQEMGQGKFASCNSGNPAKVKLHFINVGAEIRTELAWITVAVTLATLQMLAYNVIPLRAERVVEFIEIRHKRISPIRILSTLGCL